jgi:hypothetical protein
MKRFSVEWERDKVRIMCTGEKYIEIAGAPERKVVPSS